MMSSFGKCAGKLLVGGTLAPLRELIGTTKMESRQTFYLAILSLTTLEKSFPQACSQGVMYCDFTAE